MENKPLQRVMNRRDFTRLLAYGGISLTLAGMLGAEYIGGPIWDQYLTWQESSCDANTFLKKYHQKLSQMHLGINLCPDYKLFAAEVDPDTAVSQLKESIGFSHARLGLRWNTHAEQGMSVYDPWINALLKHDIQTVISYGLRSPFPPEVHLPQEVEKNLRAMNVIEGSTITAGSPLGQLTLEYSNAVLDYYDREFGLTNFAGFHPENEFDSYFGKYQLGIAPDMMIEQAKLVHEHTPAGTLLINTPCVASLNRPASLKSAVSTAVGIKDTFDTLQVRVGADIYEETEAGRVRPNAYIDTIAGIEMLKGPSEIPDAKKKLAKAGIPLEVTEFQVSEWVREPRRNEPGSRIHTQYLLARIADNLVDDNPDRTGPFVVRLWEMSNIILQMLKNDKSFSSNDVYPLVSSINTLSR